MKDILRLLLPLLAWLASFSAIYGLHGIGCGLCWPEISYQDVSLVRFALLSAWFAAIFMQVALLFALHMDRFKAVSVFMQWTSIATGWVGLVAVFWTLYPVAVIAACGTYG
ncbi:hypothetical protein DSM110093_03450 (plasmid) [Sulfitobacter sp. DSM 110093]|uniref:hypothetical protein n=1 Tax=Sulfitobacter sp. DSM 110093 TaxID=2883127 RepID=UPI001FAD9886|nr:hypothetical protein [Sulfitobacter sp. DSM 110093]UOA33615.1 hypothetical protein DSM110093_03450 [Sulfitobacter sp. DSM 110093]